MIPDNNDSYEAFRWIMENADEGFFIVTAPHVMQHELAELYKPPAVAVYDYSQNASPYSYPELSSWVESRPDAKFLFILDMQLALRDENDMLSFNMSRDMLSGKNKAWLFFMTKDLEYRLSTHACDAYSYVKLKIHFLPNSAADAARPKNIMFDKPIGSAMPKETLARYKGMEGQLMALPLDGTPGKQLLSAGISLSIIAGLHNACAEYADAFNLYHRVKEIREKTIGTRHPDTAATYNDIANTCYLQNEDAKALEWYGKALAIWEDALGKEHPSTASAYSNIANVYCDQGDSDKALGLFGVALAIREKTLGMDHPATANTYSNMAYVHYSRGDYAKSLELYGKALAINEKALGKGSPGAAATCNSIASVYCTQGDYAKALEFFGKALALQQKTFGEDHMDAAATCRCMAYVYRKQGDNAKAQELNGKADLAGHAGPSPMPQPWRIMSA